MRPVVNEKVLERLLLLTPQSKTLIKQLEVLNKAIYMTCFKGRYLEIGSFEGRSLAMYSILALLNNLTGSALITCIDSWDGGDEHKIANTKFKKVENTFDQVSEICLEILPANSKIEKIKAYSKYALSSIINRTKFYDMILVDGGHKAKDVISDLVMAWGLLCDGGILIIDDYTWMPKHLTNNQFLINSPKLGVDSFLNCFSDELVIVSNQPLLQLYIKKQSPSDFVSHGSHCLTLVERNLPDIFNSMKHLL
tara:strand:- start:375 stop:1130 length:756 start_codon:yes stop_codon:yes gene_type:complete